MNIQVVNKVCELVVNGFGRRKISTLLGISPRQIDNIYAGLKSNSYKDAPLSKLAKAKILGVKKSSVSDGEISDLFDAGMTISQISARFGIKEQAVSKIVLKDTNEVLDLISEYPRDLQKERDKTRIANKKARESYRVENALTELSRALIETFDRHNLSKLTKSHEEKKSQSSVAVLHLSDCHFSELVDLQSNKYDFVIAGRRLKAFVSKAKKYWKAMGVKKVLVAMTGDMLNSDRRLEEKLSMAANRSQALFLAIDLLQQLILDVNEEFNVSVAAISGNEGRVNQELGWDVVAQDNYDFMIFEGLRRIFKGSKGISFLEGGKCEMVVNVAGHNLLLLHGHGGMGKDLDRSVQQLFGRYSSSGQKIDYAIFGHIHSAYVSDYFSRSSSLVGSNAYSERGLGLMSRASQNTYIFHADGTRESLKIDLQDPGMDGYNIEDSLSAYNTKSHDKLHRKQILLIDPIVI